MPELLRVEAQRNAQVAVLRYEPRRARGVTLVAGHGYSSSKHNLDSLCSFLAGHGFALWSFDFPGHKLGASGGWLRSIDDCIDAMQAVIDAARARDATPIYTLGQSMGAMTALFCAGLDAQITGAIALTTGYGRPSALTALANLGATDFRASYVEGATLPELLADVEARYIALLPRLAGRPVLYVAASRDGMVSPASVRELYDRAPEPKTFRSIESDHTDAATHARTVVLEWLGELHPR